MNANNNLIDSPSYLGQFGWEEISADLAVPVIVRSNQIRYSPVRIVEQEIIKKYDALPQKVFQCITLKSFYLTAAEAKLLNTINFAHCNNRYGDAFFSQKDVIISGPDAKELSKFLTISQNIFSQGLHNYEDKFGVIKLSVDPLGPGYTMLVPYIGKGVIGSDAKRFVPSKMVVGHTEHSKAVRAMPNDWDIMYLKMLSIYCRNDPQNLISRDDPLISLDGLVYPKTGTPIIYEDHMRHEEHNWQS